MINGNTVVSNFESNAIPTETILPLSFVLLIIQSKTSPPILSIAPLNNFVLSILLLFIFSNCNI